MCNSQGICDIPFNLTKSINETRTEYENRFELTLVLSSVGMAKIATDDDPERVSKGVVISTSPSKGAAISTSPSKGAAISTSSSKGAGIPTSLSLLGISEVLELPAAAAAGLGAPGNEVNSKSDCPELPVVGPLIRALLRRAQFSRAEIRALDSLAFDFLQLR